MKRPTFRLLPPVLGTEPLRTLWRLFALLDLTMILVLAWGSRGLVLACLLQAFILALSAPW